MNQHLFVKMSQLIVAYMDVGEGREPGCGSFASLGNRLAITCDWRLDLVRSDASDFNFTSEWLMN